MEIILLIVLLFILYPVFRVILTIWSTTRKFKKQYRDFTGGANQSANQNNAQHNQPYHSQRKKVFDNSDGEYVDFEEIKVEESNDKTNQNSPNADNYSESQISDATFEEIK